MFVKKSYNKGRVYLSFVQGYRENGKVKQKTIEKIGYLDELEDLYPDPLEHFKQVAKERSLSDTPVKIEVDTSEILGLDDNLRKNLGYCGVKKIYGELEINKFFHREQSKQGKIEFNLNHIFCLLIFNRFLQPSSKKRAFESKDTFFERTDFSLDDIYRALDIFADKSEALQQHLHMNVTKKIGRRQDLNYYDVTNFYFEIPYNDEDVHDEEGTVVKKGFRKKGPSKENRKTPIVQMGLLMDSNGLPVAFNTFPGNESEKTSLLPTVRRVKNDYDVERVIVVADRGLNTSDNTTLLAGKNLTEGQGDGYVYGQSIAGSDKAFQNWALNPNGFITSIETDEEGKEIPFKHKSRVFSKTVQLKNSQGQRTQKIDICQKQMVYYSEKYAKKQRKERDLILEKAKDLIANPGKYRRATSYGAAAYINNIHFSDDTGEISNANDLSINLERIKAEERLDGFYAIVTSEIELSDKEIRDIYRGLWKIEESFKTIKKEFVTRPIYHRLEDRINAHILVCFVSLLISRILEMKLGNKYSSGKIRDSIEKYSCSRIDQNYYMFDYRDDVIVQMEKAFDLNLSKKIMSQSEIKKILEYT